MKNKFRILASLLFFFFTTQSFSNPISKINFIGLNNALEESLLQIIPFKSGQEYTSALSDGIIESLFETGLFSDISITNNLDTLNITLNENPTIKYLNITLDKNGGFTQWIKGEKLLFTTETLQDELNNLKLSTGNPYTKSKLNDFITTLEFKYSELGYYNLKIIPNVIIDSMNRAGIDITINQGERVKISTFNISGASDYREEDLLSLFKIGEADISIINFFTNKNLFTEAEFRKGLDSMTNKYFDSGYLDFNVINVDTSLDDKKENISITINISEGIQYELGEVSFSGEYDAIDISELKNAISLKKGDIFNRNIIIKDIQTLTDLYADQGYAFININPITSDFLNTINVNFDISLNKKVFVNRITISGNTRTQDEVIRREILLSEGSQYSRSLLRDSLLSLRRLGYFSDVEITTSEVDGMPDKIDINFQVEETQTGSVSFSVSHSNNYGISFGAGIQEKNIFGSGNTLNANLNISESYNKLSLYFMNPNYNDQRHSVSIGAFKSEINDDEIAVNSYEIDSTGFSLGYGIPLANDSRINSEFEYSTNDIKCSALFAGPGYESSQCANKNRDEFKINLNWNRNTLNDYLYPTNGLKNTLAANLSLPFGDYKYFNLNAGHSSYQSISDSVTLKLSGSINLSKGYGGKELPFYKRHFGGGSGSVRGFGNKSLGPLYPNGKAKGGEIAILGSANLITPAFFFDNNDKMRVSAFIDAGNIFEKSSNINHTDIRVSTGVGFAYLSPIGSIGAFISTPILKKDGDIIEDFGFSLGTGF